MLVDIFFSNYYNLQSVNFELMKKLWNKELLFPAVSCLSTLELIGEAIDEAIELVFWYLPGTDAVAINWALGFPSSEY